MLEPPFKFDPSLSAEELQKIGQLSIRWAKIEHVIGHCLRKILRLSHEEAAITIFPLSLDQRLTRINELAKIGKLRPEAEDAFYEVWAFKTAVQKIRNFVIHALVEDDEDGQQSFFLRSKGYRLTKQQILSAEEMTNYMAHTVISLRYAIGFNVDPSLRHPLPDRPDVPEFLRGDILQPRPRKHTDQQEQASQPPPSDT